MLSFIGFIAVVAIVAILFFLILMFGLGAMHQHLRNKGVGFGRDDDLHAKVDELLQEKRNNATFTTKH